MSVKEAIDIGDSQALRHILAEDRAQADALILWGEGDKNRTHPLHYVSDKFFDKTLTSAQAVALVDVLLEAGSSVDGHKEARETPLIGAASLGAEDVGLRLLDAGADPKPRGSFANETALHWAAHEGLDRLVTRLLEAGADPNLKDNRWEGTPLEWAKHGRSDRAIGNTSGHDKAISLLSGT